MHEPATESNNVDVVVIDDDDTTRYLATRRAKKSGLSIRVFENPGELKTFLSSFSARLILIDLRMPVMNGEELLEDLLQNHCENASNIFLCTSAAPDKATYNRVESMGAKILLKDAVYSSDGFASLINEVHSH